MSQPDDSKPASSKDEPLQEPATTKDDDNKITTHANGNGTPTAPEPQPVDAQAAQDIQPPPTPTQPPQAGWLGWIMKTPAKPIEPIEEEQPEQPEPQRPSTPPAQIILTPVAQSEPRPTTSSWFSLWTTPAPTAMAVDPEKPPPTEEPQNAPNEDVVMQDAPLEETAQSPPPQAGSTWAFWSKATPVTKDTPSTQQPGEIAVIGEGSEAHPLPITENGVSAEPDKETTKAKDVKDSKSTWRRGKRPRPISVDESVSPSPASSQLHIPEPSGGKSDQSDAESRKSTAKPESSSKSVAESTSSAKHPPNLLLPTFSSTYQMKENPSIMQQITNLLLRTSQSPTNHVFRVQETPKIKKALAIGVHGLFPATYLRPMIGQPTGTSLRFASLCADGIRRWADAHGCSDCEIEKVALEGEGRISERVENLWKLLLNWIDQIRKADLIVIACHSQGVPVALILLEKLIDLGIITNARIGVCAMAGVALGPFPDYKSSFFMGSAAELWDFGNPQSPNSQRFEASLKRVLDYGARVTFIGSIDDQVVPMEVSHDDVKKYKRVKLLTCPVGRVLARLPPIYIPGRLYRRPHTRARLHRPSHWLRPQAAQPRRQRPWPRAGAVPRTRRLALLWRGPLAAVLRQRRVRPGHCARPRDDQCAQGHAVPRCTPHRAGLDADEWGRRRACPGVGESIRAALDHARVAGGGLCQDGAEQRDGGAAAAV